MLSIAFYRSPSVCAMFQRHTIVYCILLLITCRLHATFQQRTIVYRILSFTTRTRDVPMTYHRLPTSVGLAQACPNDTAGWSMQNVIN